MQNVQSMNEALEEFYMVQTVRGNSAATVRDYRQKLGVFASFKAISNSEIISAWLCGGFPSEILALSSCRFFRFGRQIHVLPFLAKYEPPR